MEGIPGVWNEERGTYGIRVQRNTIPDYETPDFLEAVGMWQDWKMFGFPRAGGTLDQPTLYIRILRLMESYSREYHNVET